MSSGAVRSALRHAAEQGVFPGAVLHASRHGTTLIHHAVGYAAIRPRKIRMTPATIFDLASLTKPVATTTAAMRLVDRSALRLEDEVGRYIPEFSGGEKDRVTIRHLLNHSSGLRAWQPLYKEVIGSAQIRSGRLRAADGKKRVLDRILRNRLVYTPGSKSIYSDLGFILLGEIIERVSGISLDRFCRNEIFGPLRMRKTFFPSVGPDRAGPYASTERIDWRGRIVVGEVHDNNAYVMGGVSGHAGLFSTAADLDRFGRAMLEARRGESPLFSRKTVETFISRQDTPGSSWALGWDTPSKPSSAGRYFSSHSFGHLGYTGTSLWIDPEDDLVVVLLTNRVHPTSRNVKIRKFRPLIHDLIYREVIHDQA